MQFSVAPFDIYIHNILYSRVLHRVIQYKLPDRPKGGSLLYYEKPVFFVICTGVLTLFVSLL